MYTSTDLVITIIAIADILCNYSGRKNYTLLFQNSSLNFFQLEMKKIDCWLRQKYIKTGTLSVISQPMLSL